MTVLTAALAASVAVNGWFVRRTALVLERIVERVESLERFQASSEAADEVRREFSRRANYPAPQAAQHPSRA